MSNEGKIMKTVELEKEHFYIDASQIAEVSGSAFAELVESRSRTSLIPSTDSAGLSDLDRIVNEAMMGQERVIRDMLQTSTVWELFYPGIEMTPEALENGVQEQLDAVKRTVVKNAKVLIQKKKGYVFLKFLRGKAVHKYAFQFFGIAVASAIAVPLLVASLFAPSTNLMWLGLLGTPLNICLFVWMYVRAKRKQL